MLFLELLVHYFFILNILLSLKIFAAIFTFSFLVVSEMSVHLFLCFLSKTLILNLKFYSGNISIL